MPITSTHYAYDGSGKVTSVEVEYTGRVLKVETYTDRRNHSDTLDYSDWRTTQCTRALVWLGTFGRPSVYTTEERELAPHEQFRWIDCTNIFVWRGSPEMVPVADVGPDSEPLMLVNFIAYESFLKAEAERLAREAAVRAEEERKEREKKEAARAKREAKDNALKAAAEALLASAPKKGTQVKVGDFVGTVFWTGATKYHGKWSARLGVKQGTRRDAPVVWCEVGEAVPV